MTNMRLSSPAPKWPGSASDSHQYSSCGPSLPCSGDPIRMRPTVRDEETSMATLDQLLGMVDAARDEIIAFSQDLVRIPTVNYGSRPDTGNETAACGYLRDKLAADGIDSEIYESAPSRG